jgi:hypothetical protein
VALSDCGLGGALIRGVLFVAPKVPEVRFRDDYTSRSCNTYREESNDIGRYRNGAELIQGPAAGMTPSDESQIASQPLLRDTEIWTPDALEKEQDDAFLRALEDGSDSGSEFAALGLQRRPGFWTRLRTSMRRRRNVGFRSAGFHGGEQSRGNQKKRRRCCVVTVLIVCLL